MDPTGRSKRLPLTPEQLASLCDKAKDYALCNGLVMRQSSDKTRSDFGQIAPISLLPSPFPRKLYEQAREVQKDMNLLYYRVAFDFDFIYSSLESVLKTDEFNRKLMEIYQEIRQSYPNYVKVPVLQIQRSDYMCHYEQTSDGSDLYALKQIEVNNIASSFCNLAARVTAMHGYVLNEMSRSNQGENITAASLPENQGDQDVSNGLAEAWKLYGCDQALVLHVIEDGNQNIADQRLTEYLLLNKTNHRARSIRLTLTQCSTLLKLDEENLNQYEMPRLRLTATNEEISVVYFRSGYVPWQYHSDVEWSGRRLLERSGAIKSPWIGLHLAGTKKVQQTLAGEGIVEKYLNDRPREAVQLVRSTFAGLWGLEAGSAQTTEIISKAKGNPKKFVLKPQLEGGGNNIYGEDILKEFEKLTPEELEAFILMERVFPLTNKNYLIQPGKPVELADVISELGIYGYLLGKGGGQVTLKNETSGHNFRTKTINTDEGGIMAGAAALDSPFLF